MFTRFILYAVLILVLYWRLRGFIRAMAQGLGAGRGPARRVEDGVKMARDPVCGTFVIPANALAVRDAGGLHHFCSDKCRDAFVARARRSS